MVRKLLSLIVLLSWFGSNAQTVAIGSGDNVCLNELLNFQANTTGSVTAYNWNFGDNSTSTQKNTSHEYTQYGPKNVTLEVTFADGSKGSASKSIMVHDLPTANFSLANANFCFNQQNVCLTDNSTMGATTNGYANRLVLWGDGAQTATSNPANSSVCYSSYPNIGTYKILVEVVNDKGCEDKWEQTITILKDYIPSFYVNKKQAQCNEQEFCFVNDSTTRASEVQSWEWDYGDGTTETGNWGQSCHTYTSKGVFTVTFKVKLTNGCEAELKKTITVNFPKVETNISIGDTVLCYPQAFSFANPVVAGATYNWELYDSNQTIIKVAGYNIVQQIPVPCPGDYYVRLKLKLGNCVDYSRFVKISSQGIAPSFKVLNKNQCQLEDTVYFLNQSKQHPDARPSYLWKFDDNNASNCIGIPPNCNYDTSFNTQHYYTDTGCYVPVLIVTDLESGCVDSSAGIVSITNPVSIKFEAKINRPCIGIKAAYDVRFFHNLCDAKIETCLDSLLDPTLFGDFAPVAYYPSVADSNGFVTVGFAVTLGSEKIYRSADTSDYYIDSSRICQDTIWYHNMFQLFPEPILDFTLERDPLCLPVKAKLRYNGGQDDKIAFIKYTWEPSQAVQTHLVLPDTVPDIEHLYTKEGAYDIFILIEDTNGCYHYEYKKELFGYHNSIRVDSIICLGDEVIFKDSIRYWNDPKAYWEEYNGTETMSWNFGDGNGFDSTSHWPSYTYANKGNYIVQLASVDANGCTDTTTVNIEVTGVNANILNKAEIYLCDQIIQFFDSSYFDNASTNDLIKEYYWDFGDYSTESFLEDPFHYYSSNGEFTLTHAITSEAGCTDTAQFTVYLSGPEPYFEILSDSVGCVPFTAKFKSTSTKVSSLIWKMGDATNTTIYSQNDTILEFTYTEPGIYYIYLDGSDSFYNADANNTYTCSAIFPDTNRAVHEVRRIVVLPIPQASFEFIEPVCVNQPVVFNSTSDTIYKEYKWNIDGFDTLTLQQQLTYTFKQAGTFDIGFYPHYIPQGPYQRQCYDTAFDQIEVSEVIANFGFVEEGLCSEFKFFDSSIYASSYSWDFGHPESDDDNYSYLQNPEHEYGKDSGTFEVCLIVNNEFNCLDTMCKTVEGKYYSELILYNVFTPGGDNFNETFSFDVENTKTYLLKIYNRWGEKVFESTDPNEGWDGTDYITGLELPSSTYFYILDYGFNCDKKARVVEGIVALIR